MQKQFALPISDVSVVRIGALLLVIGLLSLAQAANLFPLGSSTYPNAIALIAIGVAGALIKLSKKDKLVKHLQAALLLIGVALVVIF